MESSYHHGSLREALIVDGRRLLVERGPDAVTLRELARRAEVSHGAPRRHFADRDALLGAIAARGFAELTDVLRSAAQADGLRERLTSYAHAYVGFARENGPLLALMFDKTRVARGEEAQAAQEFFALGAGLLGQIPSSAPEPTVYLVAATLEGISSLVVAGRLPAERVDAVIDLAVAALASTIEG